MLRRSLSGEMWKPAIEGENSEVTTDDEIIEAHVQRFAQRKRSSLDKF